MTATATAAAIAPSVAPESPRRPRKSPALAMAGTGAPPRPEDGTGMRFIGRVGGAGVGRRGGGAIDGPVRPNGGGGKDAPGRLGMGGGSDAARPAAGAGTVGKLPSSSERAEPSFSARS